MQHDGLDDLVADREDRVQRGHRLLEDHGDAVAAQRAALAFRQRQQVLAFEQDAAARFGQQARQRQQRGRFAGAVGADQGSDFLGVQVQVDAADGFDMAVVDLESADFQHDAHLAASACSVSSSSSRPR
ncbi:hypothetical protein G6F46_013943 [Rhizopus delemar]|nr:hypothetical protein G6F46_013943 [Rhizopus delemar]